MGLSPALAPLLGAVVLGHLGWQAIFAVLLGLALLLIVPTLLLKEPPRVASRAVKARVSYWQLLSTATFSGNVMIFAACSASFFAWLTASPFILGDMGYSPSDIGLSYALPTVAFMVGGYRLYVVATQTVPTLTTLLIPFCLMALVNGASYPIVVASALKPFSQNSGKAAGLQNTLQLGLCFLGSLLVSSFISQPLQITVEVMLATAPLAVLGYLIQRRKVNAEVLAAS